MNNRFLDLCAGDIHRYLALLNSEREYLTAAYMAHTGLIPDQIVLVTRDDSRFYPAPRDPQLDDIAPEVRRLKAERASLRARTATLEAALRMVLTSDAPDLREAAQIILDGEV